jgi:hypothetical protein
VAGFAPPHVFLPYADFAPPYFPQKNLRNVSFFAQDFPPRLLYSSGTQQERLQANSSRKGIFEKGELPDGREGAGNFTKKGGEIMTNFTNLYGLPTTILDFTNDFSLLLVGLVGLVWLSSGMIVWLTVWHYWSERTSLASRDAPASIDYRDAA